MCSQSSQNCTGETSVYTMRLLKHQLWLVTTSDVLQAQLNTFPTFRIAHKTCCWCTADFVRSSLCNANLVIGWHRPGSINGARRTYRCITAVCLVQSQSQVASHGRLWFAYLTNFSWILEVIMIMRRAHEPSDRIHSAGAALIIARWSRLEFKKSWFVDLSLSLLPHSFSICELGFCHILLSFGHVPGVLCECFLSRGLLKLLSSLVLYEFCSCDFVFRFSAFQARLFLGSPRCSQVWQRRLHFRPRLDELSTDHHSVTSHNWIVLHRCLIRTSLYRYAVITYFVIILAFHYVLFILF